MLIYTQQKQTDYTYVYYFDKCILVQTLVDRPKIHSDCRIAQFNASQQTPCYSARLGPAQLFCTVTYSVLLSTVYTHTR